MTVSIIVPIYYGKKYIPSLIKQAELCKENLSADIKIELVLSNDAPGDSLDDSYVSDTVDIMVLNTDINRGIQGARIRGVQVCSGEYILMLDQDDKVMPTFVESQLKAIGDADAVVCRLLHEDKLFYTNDNVFEKVVTKEFMMNKGHAILSPGQVLIKKSSISQFWVENILTMNGADDTMLWLCMLGENKTFALNQEVLFEHVVNGMNTSWDLNQMLRSEREMIEVLKQNPVFDGEQRGQIGNLESVYREEHLKVWDKFRKMYYCLDKWLQLLESGKNPAKLLKKKNIHKVAIYGMGYLGKRIRGFLQAEGISVMRYIDRNAEYIQSNLPVNTLQDTPQDFDAVIISVVQNYDGIIRDLEDKYDIPIWPVSDLLSETERNEA